MPILEPQPETVPFDEVVKVLESAAQRASGGPPALIVASGHYLAAALAAAGFRVVRDPAPAAQMTM